MVQPQSLVRKGVGSNPTLINISFAFCLVMFGIQKSGQACQDFTFFDCMQSGGVVLGFLCGCCCLIVGYSFLHHEWID